MFHIEWLCNLSTAHIHTPSCTPLEGARSVRTSLPAYPHDPLVADRLLSTKHRFHQDWWLPSPFQARTSTTFPFAFTAHQGLPLAWTCMRPT
jgi:hypothetical protein